MKSSYAPSEGNILRMSKSSLMCYLKCPRQYWWRYVGLPDVKAPPSPEMLRGTDVHNAIDSYFADGVLDTLDGDPAMTAFSEIQNDLDKLHPEFNTLETEKRVEALYKFESDGVEYAVQLVGVVDMLMTAFEEDTLCITEVKTGQFSAAKLGRTRKELAYYHFLLSLSGEYDDKEFTHFAYLAPDATDHKLFVSETKKRNKHLLSGQLQGLMLIEKINKRTINSLVTNLEEAVKSIYAAQWPMKWSEYYCSQWCDFALSCDAELNGLTEPVV